MKPLVSVFIPAYNLPDYTKKTIQSIFDQSYRPLEVLLLDDCSPINLEYIYLEFKKEFQYDDNIEIKYIRNIVNLGHDNHVLGFDLSKGKYVINMPHDDWFLYNDFIKESVELMELNEDCNLCAANSIVEYTDYKMIKLPNNISNPLSWNILNGDEYIKILGMKGIGYQAWSGLIFNKKNAEILGTYHYPFSISIEMGKELDIIPDEFFAFQFLLSSIGSIAISEKIVSVRGNPKTSFVNSRKNEWAKSIGLTSFIIHYNLYKANLTGKFSKTVKKEAIKRIFHFPMNRISFKIFKFYKYSLVVLIFMSLAYLFSFFKIFHVLKGKIRNSVKILLKKYKIWEKK